MKLHRVTLTMGLVAFSLFASTSAGYAMWSANATSAGRVETGTVAVAQSGAEALAVTYNLTTLDDTAPLTVTNTGTLTAPHTLRVNAPATSALAQAVAVRTWPVAASTLCNAGAAVPASATSSSLVNVPALAATLAPDATATYCIRTSITAEQQRVLAAQSMVVTSSVTAAIGSWSSTPVAGTAVQTLADTTPPSVAIVTSRTLRTSTTLSWSASSDNTGTTGYSILEGTRVVATVTGTTTTISGLIAGTRYTYSVRATDAAGNTSTSAAVIVEPVNITTGIQYSLLSSAGARCLDRQSGGASQGMALIDVDCNGSSNRIWTFATSDTDYFTITAANTALVWGVDGTGTFGQLSTATRAITQDWQVVAVALDTFQFVNRASGTCLQLGSVTGNSVNTTLATCATITQQTFSMRLR